MPKSLLTDLIEVVKICDRMSYGLSSDDDKKLVNQKILNILKKIDGICI